MGQKSFSFSVVWIQSVKKVLSDSLVLPHSVQAWSGEASHWPKESCKENSLVFLKSPVPNTHIQPDIDRNSGIQRLRWQGQPVLYSNTLSGCGSVRTRAQHE